MQRIDGFPSYSVTREGVVYSHKFGKLRKLKPLKVTKGYLSVVLFEDGVRKQFKLHRLVADAYLSNPNNLPQVNHKDGDKENNSVENLEWCTGLYNMRHAYETGLKVNTHKHLHLKEEMVRLSKEGHSTRAIARMLEVSKSTVALYLKPPL